ncbi:MAG: family 10 glycosylhydrolase [Prevotellaceae bacterium]|nr:family 10 glycosylhydrolase [Prevotellaceae bacterium]
MIRPAFTALLLFVVATVCANTVREFRGAWIQCVNGQFMGMSTADMQKTLTYQLDELQKDGANAIIFQVRPECDALYNSSIEPWSRFLTGEQGKAPSPYWDPLQWMIEQCHKRGMELHAWINPYRAKTKTTHVLSPKHIAHKRRDLVFEYDGQYILNPAYDENRQYICHVVGDILRRYDVDGLHIDDYFYPYPAAGCTIPDEQLYRRNPGGHSNIGDWRRYNVNLFMKEMHDTIRAVKPWVKFGVSPFGIYRNKKSDPNGSDTRGLQNYDDLYADVLLWINNGWVDYCVPQIYWQIGHPTADYKTLIQWWDRNASARPLYIGEDVERTVKYKDDDNPNQHQMPAKYKLHDFANNVQGTVLWYAKAAVDNIGNYGMMLRNVYWRTPALQPLMPFISKKQPGKPRKVKMVWTSDGPMLFWTAPKTKSKSKDWASNAHQYAVYCDGTLVAVTSDTFFKLPYVDGKTKHTYVVTSLNRIHNESKAVKKKIKL